jgi:hypothetical protein
MRLYDIGFFRTKPIGKAIVVIYSRTPAGKKELLEFTKLCGQRFPIRTFNLDDHQIQLLFKDYAYLRYKFGFSMIDYFLYELYRGSELIESLYMSDRDRVKIHRKVNQSDCLHYFGDKRDFYNKFHEYMQKDCIFIENENDKSAFVKFVADKDKVVIKPRDGQRGIGVEIVSVAAEDQIQMTWQKCLKDRLLVEKVIKGCEEIQAFHEISLNTIRISTVLDPKGKAHILSATIRTGTGVHVVDNGHLDGVYAAIDVDTGMISTIGYNANGDRFPVHPDSCKPFAGFIIPEWDRLKVIAIEVAGIVPQMRYIGWDWVLDSDHRWLLIEGNEPGGIDVHQHPGFVMKKNQYVKELGL